MWEKQSDDGTIHDKDNTYTWFTAVTVHIAELNAGHGFAGYRDWRVPNVKELQSIVNYENENPAVSPAFNTACVALCTVLTCSCTAAAPYWSSSLRRPLPPTPLGAWFVGFEFGDVDATQNIGFGHARAGRGGL